MYSNLSFASFFRIWNTSSTSWVRTCWPKHLRSRQNPPDASVTSLHRRPMSSLVQAILYVVREMVWRRICIVGLSRHKFKKWLDAVFVSEVFVIIISRNGLTPYLCRNYMWALVQEMHCRHRPQVFYWTNADISHLKNPIINSSQISFIFFTFN